jgi:hypothetical protein
VTSVVAKLLKNRLIPNAVGNNEKHIEDFKNIHAIGLKSIKKGF